MRQYPASEKYIRRCLIDNFKDAAPSNEVACGYLEYAVILQNKHKHRVDRVEVKHLLERAMYCVKEGEDVKRSEYMIPMVYIEMALFHTHSFEKPTFDSRRPSEEDLETARRHLRVSERYNNIKSKRGNAYLVRQKVALASLSFYDRDYTKAVDYMEDVLRIMTKSGGVDEHNLHIKDRAVFYRHMLKHSR